MTDEGGEDACWLDRVCDACGAITDAGAPHVCRPVARGVEDDEDRRPTGEPDPTRSGPSIEGRGQQGEAAE